MTIEHAATGCWKWVAWRQFIEASGYRQAIDNCGNAVRARKRGQTTHFVSALDAEYGTPARPGTEGLP